MNSHGVLRVCRVCHATPSDRPSTPIPPTLPPRRCGDLAQKVERYKRRRQYIDENVIWRYLVQCLKALQYLHERGICHRDIKAANTFLAEDGSIKLGDMNVSKRLQKGQLQTQIGTPYYMSPEIWNNRPYDASADLWALGCMIYGMQHPSKNVHGVHPPTPPPSHTHTHLPPPPTFTAELAALRPPFTGNTFPELKRAGKTRPDRSPKSPPTYASLPSLTPCSPRPARSSVRQVPTHTGQIFLFAGQGHRTHAAADAQ